MTQQIPPHLITERELEINRAVAIAALSYAYKTDNPGLSRVLAEAEANARKNTPMPEPVPGLTTRYEFGRARRMTDDERKFGEKMLQEHFDTQRDREPPVPKKVKELEFARASKRQNSDALLAKLVEAVELCVKELRFLHNARRHEVALAQVAHNIKDGE